MTVGREHLDGCLAIPSGASVHKERQVTLPALIHLLIQ